MAYVTREDGEHFVVPAYRDLLTGKGKALHDQVQALSKNYGHYVILQHKQANQYEVALSPDMGYLLGESIWHYFNKPTDLVYCEAIPNTTEVLLVVVQGNTVYLDGNFAAEHITDELIIFLTQKNNFDIYVYGDVPISETQAEGKFTFPSESTKSFHILDTPALSKLPLLNIYQLQPIEKILRSSTFALPSAKKTTILLIILVILGWQGWSWLTTATAPPPAPEPQENPYKDYYTALTSPSPEQELEEFFLQAKRLLAMPGWMAGDIQYSQGKLTTVVTSSGSKIATLLTWAENNKITATLNQNNITLTIEVKPPPRRPLPTKIYPLQAIIARLTDRIATIYPGNHLQLSTITDKGSYKITTITINFADISPMVFKLIGLQLKGLPFTLKSISLKIGSNFSGAILVDAFGN